MWLTSKKKAENYLKIPFPVRRENNANMSEKAW